MRGKPTLPIITISSSPKMRQGNYRFYINEIGVQKILEDKNCKELVFNKNTLSLREATINDRNTITIKPNTKERSYHTNTFFGLIDFKEGDFLIEDKEEDTFYLKAIN